jgi:electron transport complex protein RnfB
VNKLPPRSAALSEAIDAALPQTQCTRCGYPACRPYAEAIAQGLAEITQCPPGGDAGIRKLAAITGRPYQALNPAHGIDKPRQIAVIDEGRCIGCTICIKACPVDAIVGGFKYMHTVIAEDCTGCELCVAPCPVDCIAMADLPTPSPWTDADAQRSRLLYRRHQQRLAQSAPVAGDAPVAPDRLAGILDKARARAQSRS